MAAVRHFLRTQPGAATATVNRPAAAPKAQTAMHKAAVRGHVEVCRVLLAARANLEAQDIEGPGPLTSGSVAHGEARYGKMVVQIVVIFNDFHDIFIHFWYCVLFYSNLQEVNPTFRLQKVEKHGKTLRLDPAASGSRHRRNSCREAAVGDQSFNGDRRKGPGASK